MKEIIKYLKTALVLCAIVFVPYFTGQFVDWYFDLKISDVVASWGLGLVSLISLPFTVVFIYLLHKEIND